MSGATQNIHNCDKAQPPAKIAGPVLRARESLGKVIAETTRHGVVRYELEARLAFCEIEAKSDPATARAYAKTLGEDARSKGLGLIATQGARPGGLIPRQFPRILVL